MSRLCSVLYFVLQLNSTSFTPEEMEETGADESDDVSS